MGNNTDQNSERCESKLMRAANTLQSNSKSTNSNFFQSFSSLPLLPHCRHRCLRPRRQGRHRHRRHHRQRRCRCYRGCRHHRLIFAIACAIPIAASIGPMAKRGFLNQTVRQHLLWGRPLPSSARTRSLARCCVCSARSNPSYSIVSRIPPVRDHFRRSVV